MSYNPTTWADGDEVTPALLNKMEQGVGGGSSAFFVNCTYNSNIRCAQADKTWGEIYNAINSGAIVYVKLPIGDAIGKAGSSIYCISVVKKFVYRPQVVDPNLFTGTTYYLELRVALDSLSIYQESDGSNSANDYPMINLNFG